MAIDKNSFKVLIIGGGNCGLSLATGLKQVGISYTVFERESEHDFYHSIRNWSMLLHWGTQHLKNLVPEPLKARIGEIQVDPHNGTIGAIPFIDARNGQVFKAVPVEPGTTRVSKRKIRYLLTQGQNMNIKYNKRLVRLSFDEGRETITAHFNDGTQDEGHLVVGCDGSRSKVREYVVGVEAAKPQDLDLTTINFSATDFTREQAIKNREYHHICKLSIQPDVSATALLAALEVESPNPEDWKFQNYTSWWGPPLAQDLEDHQVRLEFYKDRMGMFCEPFRSAALLGAGLDAPKNFDDEPLNQDGKPRGTSSSTETFILPIYPGQQWSPLTPASWDNHGGRVTLAGDAAHSMLPHRGQGINHAFADADYLVAAIASAVNPSADGVAATRSLENVIGAYEEEMRQRGGKEVALSYEQAIKSRDVESWLRDSPLATVGVTKQK
ncbi:hypothetical protein BX600DRAFT_450625 [Xylariales sp. PMI_506]|nr:hypothetical protein BX600DRAFT_450625 [Xylariales sp. PMI_506]